MDEKDLVYTFKRKALVPTKLTEMAFFLLLKIRVEALCMNHVVLHSGVHRGPRLVYNEGRLLCRPFFF